MLSKMLPDDLALPHQLITILLSASFGPAVDKEGLLGHPTGCGGWLLNTEYMETATTSQHGRYVALPLSSVAVGPEENYYHISMSGRSKTSKVTLQCL